VSRRIAIIGNTGGGKSTLARRLAQTHGLPVTEIDRSLWRPGWVPAPEAEFDAAHDAVISGERWIIEGLGTLRSLVPRLDRATDIVLVDLPVWMHFWLAAERQASWEALSPEERPSAAADKPPTRRLFQAIWDIHETWMPKIREMVAEREASGTATHRIHDLSELSQFDLPPRDR